MGTRFARTAFALISIAAIAGAVFRVSTAPDRIRERHQTARAVCLQKGGEWVVVDNNEICRTAEIAKQM
jgi:hypothetical protein